MNTIEMNQRAVQMIADWNPFDIPDFDYATEAADIAATMQTIDDPAALAKEIQLIFEASFEEWLPLEACEAIAQRLTLLKYEAQCDLP
ncbi:DUF1871 family protein [Kurthia massiliensis]|uniref:DUF1871 family protein n=1 Tax=Kurthia massiliensis TaxID=1033739 RepID=UPI00028816FC|nr:DUF1871 family protein [Kurthia massiliensis]